MHFNHPKGSNTAEIVEPVVTHVWGSTPQEGAKLDDVAASIFATVLS